MEARAAFREPGISKKAVWFVFAVMAALILAGTVAYMIMSATTPNAAPASHVVLAGQDFTGAEPAWNNSTRRAGTQSLDGPALPAAAAVDSATEPASGRSAGTQFVK